ncbi:MAG: response regulator transcription factor [Actinobacteria bacterium]|nr:response regulator transcription factor [Actinomycetota bacterium]
MRAIIIDDHEVVRRGIALLLESGGDIAVCGEAGTMGEAGPLAAGTTPDVAVVDLRLGDGSGVIAARAVRAASPRTRVLLLTAAAEEDALLGAVLAGASAYLLKQVQGNHIVATVREIATGRRLLDPAKAEAAVERALTQLMPVRPLDDPVFSVDEAQLLVAAAAGRPDRLIAAEQGVEVSEVAAALASLLAKLGIGGTGRPAPRSRHAHR